MRPTLNLEHCIRCEKELDKAFTISATTGICEPCWKTESKVGTKIPEGTIKQVFKDEDGNVVSRLVESNQPLTTEELLAMGIDREAQFLEMQEEMAIQENIQGFVLKASQTVKSEGAKKMLLDLDEWVSNYHWKDDELP
jgi:hypothetical protein